MKLTNKMKSVNTNYIIACSSKVELQDKVHRKNIELSTYKLR